MMRCRTEMNDSIWGQTVEVQGHGGITYAGTVTGGEIQYSTSRVKLDFLV